MVSEDRLHPIFTVVNVLLRFKPIQERTLQVIFLAYWHLLEYRYEDAIVEKRVCDVVHRPNVWQASVDFFL